MNISRKLVSILLLSACSKLIAQDHRNVELLSQISSNNWEGTELGVAVEGNYAYVMLVGVGIKVVNIRQPRFPRETGEFQFDGSLFDLAVEGNRCYIAGGVLGLIIVDVSDPTRPQEIGRTREAGSVRGVAVNGDTAYVAAGQSVVALVTSDPQNIYRLRSWQSPSFAMNIALSGNYAYVAAREGGLEVFDITTMNPPRPVATIDPQGETRDVTVLGNSLFLAESEAVSRVDISDPLHPRRTASNAFPSDEVTLGRNTLFAVPLEARNVRVYDIANGLDSLAQLSHGAKGIAVRGPIACSAVLNSGLLIEDVSDPAQATELGRIGYYLRFTSVVASGNIIFTTNSSFRLSIYDVSDPANPAPIAFDNPGSYASWSEDLYLRGNYLYGVFADYNLRIADISTPNAPRWLGYVRVGESRRITLDQNFAYCTITWASISVVDIRDPANPEEIARIPSNGMGALRDIRVRDGIAYIASSDGGLLLKDVSDLREIRDITSFPTNDEIWGLDLSGDKVYLCLARGALKIVDVSDPGSPVGLGSTRLDGTALEVKVVGDHAFLTREYGGVRIVDVSDPYHPIETGYYVTPGQAYVPAVSGSLVFVAESDRLGIYDCSAALAAPPSHPNQPATYDFAAYPSPFNSSTCISYTLPRPGRYSVDVMDLSGRLVMRVSDGWKQAGSYREALQAGGIPNGELFIRLQGEGMAETRRVTVLK